MAMYDSPGVSRPGWMSDDEWAEYRMSAEYAHEVSRPEEPDDYYYDPFDDMEADFEAARAEDEAEYQWDMGYNAYYNGEVIYGDESYDYKAGYEYAWEEEGNNDKTA